MAIDKGFKRTIIYYWAKRLRYVTMVVWFFNVKTKS